MVNTRHFPFGPIVSDRTAPALPGRPTTIYQRAALLTACQLWSPHSAQRVILMLEARPQVARTLLRSASTGHRRSEMNRRYCFAERFSEVFTTIGLARKQIPGNASEESAADYNTRTGLSSDQNFPSSIFLPDTPSQYAFNLPPMQQNACSLITSF
jgi:hypothetical protein